MTEPPSRHGSTPPPVRRLRAASAPLAALLTLAVSSTPTRVEAQGLRWQADFTGSRIAWDSIPALNAPGFTGLVEWRGAKTFARLSTGVTGFEDSGWTMQGGLDASRWISPAGPDGLWHLELGARISGSRHSSDFESYVARGDGRLHAAGTRLGAWAGISGAQTKNTLDADPVRSLVPGAGGWGRAGPALLTARYETPEVLGRRFHDVQGALSFSGGPVDLTASAGWRSRSSDDLLPDESWASGTATLWLSPGTALRISGGRYAPDVLQGLPGGDFLSVGLTITGRRVPAVVEPRSSSAFVFTTMRSGAETLSLRLPGARSVEIAGDWNEWTPDPLTRGSDGTWLLPADLPPGIYRFNLRLDGMRWIVPQGFPSTDDGFGGEVGLLIVTGDDDSGDDPGGVR